LKKELELASKEILVVRDTIRKYTVPDQLEKMMDFKLEVTDALSKWESKC
jgi:hypothetical protein